MKRNLIIGSMIVAIALPTAVLAAKDGSKGHHSSKNMFEQLDANKDGEVSLEEMTLKTTEKFQKLDKDRNGTVSIEEMSVRQKEFFTKLDTDGSGTISQDEAKAFRKMKREMRQERRAERLMERFDTNKDGKISREEYQAIAMERFDAADTKNAGFLTIEEVTDLAPNRGKKHPG
jgi:Ca2+-binding EF-hand superfamily protein